MTDKGLKGKYGRVVVFKADNYLFKFRSPTCLEYIKHIDMQLKDLEAANNYLLEECRIDGGTNPLPLSVVQSALAFFTSIYSSVTVDEYKKRQLSENKNDLLKMIYLVWFKYGVPPSTFFGITPDEILTHIMVLEEITGIMFYTEQQSTEDGVPINIDKAEVAKSYADAMQRIQNMKK